MKKKKIILVFKIRQVDIQGRCHICGACLEETFCNCSHFTESNFVKKAEKISAN